MKTNQFQNKLPFEQYEKTCELCGKRFYSKRKHTRFCSDSHRAFASRQRREALAPPNNPGTQGTPDSHSHYTIFPDSEVERLVSELEAHKLDQSILPLMLERENGKLFIKCPKCKYRIEFTGERIAQKIEREFTDHLEMHKIDSIEIMEALDLIMRKGKQILLSH